MKIPRWDTHKLRLAERTIGTEMKSVGEVMGIGRTFSEALQKAVQMLNIGASGLHMIISGRFRIYAVKLSLKDRSTDFCFV